MPVTRVEELGRLIFSETTDYQLLNELGSINQEEAVRVPQ